jgi:hypothetical protein
MTKTVKKINEEEFKSLTWQYFWQQKLREVGIFFCVIAGMGVFIRGEDKFLNTFILAVVCYILFEWIRGNWETAQERATKKLRGERK